MRIKDFPPLGLGGRKKWGAEGGGGGFEKVPFVEYFR